MENRFIIISAFNNAHEYLSECWESIKQQDYKNWLAVFSDDSSSDGSSENLPRVIRVKN
jgi:glycosyltransferase involved in cell wall biosynthesis